MLQEFRFFQFTVREYPLFWKAALEHKAKIVGVALLCFALGSAALTLGSIQGSALIGKPLDVVVPIQMDVGEDASALCFAAEVFHADTLQDARRVHVLLQASAQAQTANVRVLSSTPIDEPVVVVNLRTGCGQKATRRYVLLADLPSPVETPLIAVVDSATAPVQVPVTKELAPVVAAAASLPVGSAVSTSPVLQKSSRPRVVGKRKSLKAGAVSHKKAMIDKKAKSEQSSGQSRLKLDPTELHSDQVSSPESIAPVAPSVDASLNLQKMQTLEAELKVLRSSTAKTEASLVELRARLQKAEAERFSGVAVLGLIALVLASLAAVVWFWQRQRQRHRPSGDKDWWKGAAITQMPAAPGAEPDSVPQPTADHMVPSQSLAAEKYSKTDVAAENLSDAEFSSQVDVSMIEMGDSVSDDDDFQPAEALPRGGHAVSASSSPAPNSPSNLAAKTLPPSSELDLDLSDLKTDPVQSNQVSKTDLDLPLLSAAAQPGGLPPDVPHSEEDSNLIDFDFLEVPKPLLPTTQKPT